MKTIFKPESNLTKSVLDFVQSIIIALAIAIFLYLFVVTPSEVEGRSMEPNLYTGERLYTNRLSHWFSETDIGKTIGLSYNRNNIVVFQKPGMDMLIKRIIALPGETIELKDQRFYVNGQLLQEPYLASDVLTKEGSFLREDQKLTVPVDSYFVAGDNRPVSNDSRYIGFIKTDWIIGKPFFRIWPLARFGTLQ